MEYQVLARKFRPRNFVEMVGQEHVLQALINALDNNRLHHAYLFTGTRGVGKTTLARILAKCLNCERGVSSTPCGECSICLDIAANRMVDLIEVDAASRTKVDDTRELLENVQYAPTSGRYKIYLIDEVHMLSAHSFNALLKTLEEPPPHVKFLLATTDPQKLPVTVLSRCLQFNLKNLAPERIADHLASVLASENVPAEQEALWALARAAQGSMRDALSLTDQAIAHGNGKVASSDVSAMLGSIERTHIVDIAKALAAEDGAALLAVAAAMAEQGPDFDAAAQELLALWHQLAIAQTVPEAVDRSMAYFADLISLAAQFSREQVQLCYQMTLLGRKDMAAAGDQRAAFEMLLLRCLAFIPASGREQPRTDSAEQGGSPEVKKPQPVAPPSDSRPAAEPVAAPVEPAVAGQPQRQPTSPPAATAPSRPVEQQPRQAVADDEPPPPWLRDEPLPAADDRQQPTPSLASLDAEGWVELRRQLSLGGTLGEIASNCALHSASAGRLVFNLSPAATALYGDHHPAELADSINRHCASRAEVVIEVAESALATPRTATSEENAALLVAATEALYADPEVQRAQQLLGAVLDESSIVPSQRVREGG
jgi:DNA polymerase-3 subunit gamma/tau